jgi:membrane protease subunit (stomatin/prohibitin family)
MVRRLEIIEWLDDTGREMVHREPQAGSGEFRIGSQLVVRESQEAVFFRDGKAMGVLGAGRHTLTTQNIPFLTELVDLAFEGEGSPFRAEVYYVSRKTFTDMKWGTKEPIIFRDKELSMVRLRAFGRFSVKVGQSQLFVNKLVGTEGRYTTEAIEGYLKDVINSRLADLLGETLESIFDLAKMYDEIASLSKARLSDDFEKYGIQLVDFYINAITPPEEVQKRIDERSSMAALGNMGDYMRYKTATAVSDAAQNTAGGGGAATGVGLGAGVGMGAAMAQMMAGTMMQPGAGTQQAAAAGAALVVCPSCSRQVAPGRFCPECGKPMGSACPKCGAVLQNGAKFCPECGVKLGAAKCAGCGAEMAPGAKFCPECGKKVE